MYETILGILAIVLEAVRRYIKKKRLRDAEKVHNLIERDPVGEFLREFKRKQKAGHDTVSKTGASKRKND